MKKKTYGKVIVMTFTDKKTGDEVTIFASFKRGIYRAILDWLLIDKAEMVTVKKIKLGKKGE